jgi:hypothetical protein
MMASGFKPVGWVAAVAGAALGCYMLSLNVASERASLTGVERQIISTKQDIRTLQTELGTRGRMSQLERWNADVLALSAPSSAQFLDSDIKLARFDQRSRTMDQAAAPVRMASLEQAAPAPEQKFEAPMVTASAPAVEEPQSMVRTASYVVTRDKPLPTATRASLLDDKLVQELGAAANSEKADKADARVASKKSRSGGVEK